MPRQKTGGCVGHRRRTACRDLEDPRESNRQERAGRPEAASPLTSSTPQRQRHLDPRRPGECGADLRHPRRRALAPYSNLPALPGNGVDFVRDNGGEGAIVLLSNADQLADYLAANQLLNDVLTASGSSIPIHVADFQDRNLQYQSIGNRWYQGNEYFYLNLARMTTGHYVSIRTRPIFSELLAEVFGAMDGSITSFDLHTTLANGFTYGRFSDEPAGPVAPVSGAILQVGRYRGSFPIVVQASGVYRGEAFSQTIEVPESGVFEADSLSRKIWTDRYLYDLETGPQHNATIGEIIDVSLRERVLSLYTAFLALEPSDTVSACTTCHDETGAVTGIEPELPADTLSIAAYPNPFRDQVTIEVSYADAAEAVGATVVVYDLLGRAVRTFRDLPAADRTVRLTWDGTADTGEQVASGIYLCVVTTPASRHSLKLVRVK